MDWELLRTFEVTRRTGSFAAAARELGIEHTTVRRRIAQLEEALGQPLFERSTRGLAATEAAEAIAVEVDRMADASAAAVRAASQVGVALAGPVWVTAPPVVMPMLVRELAPLAHAHPELILELVDGRDYVDLTRREADLALRIRPTGVAAAQDDTPVRRLGPVRFAAYAPAAWAERPLHEAPFIAYNEHAPSDPARAFVDSLPTRPPIGATSNNITVMVEMVAAELGWTVLPVLSDRDYPGTVRRVDVGAPYVAWLALQSTRRNHPAVRLVADRVIAMWDAIEQVPAIAG